MEYRPHFRLKPAILSLSLAITAAHMLTAPEPALAQASAAQSFDIPAGNLDQVLKRFGLESGLELYLDGALINGQRSAGLQGEYSAFQGLQLLLSGTGLVAVEQADGAFRIGSREALLAEDALQLEALDIVGEKIIFSRDKQGHNDVFDRDLSTSYIGAEEIDRYKGSNPADLLNGVAGVFSGDARNSGALDPNIRGVQGPGRVPVTIDGTEQALTVWRGYNGATNRNYIDPNLIGGIQIIKGPALEHNVYTGIGGAVVAKTLSADDVVKPGEEVGVALRVESSSGSVSPRVPGLSTGRDYRDIDGFQPGLIGSLGDPTLRVTPKSRDDDNFLSGDDYAYRLAVGKRHEHFDALFAYAYREKGNHFSGKKNASYYSTPYNNITGTTLAELNPIRGLALGFKPGSEVMNTSSEMESWLGKFTWKISDEQRLTFGYRDSNSLYGEIMPSRIQGIWGFEEASGYVQWPLSEVDAQAYNIEYTWNPKNNRWIDLYSNLWFTDTRSDTYTSGGSPNYAHPPRLAPNDPYIINGGIRGQDNDRTGITLSNTMGLLDSLDLTLGGSYQYEKLRSDPAYVDPNNPRLSNASWSLPRSGRRQEWEGYFDFAWQPTARLKLNAGARYSSYWAFDDYLAEQQKGGNVPTTATAYRGRVASVTVPYTWTQEDWDETYSTIYSLVQQQAIDAGLDPAEQWVIDIIEDSARHVAQTQTPVGGQTQRDEVAIWYHDGKGKYDRADNPCTNGELVNATADNCIIHSETVSSGSAEVQAARQGLAYIVDTTTETQSGHDWAPFFSATYSLTDNSRIYLRYNEAIRYPSMFESTIGFSASQNIYYDIEPEHAYNYEVAFIQNMTPWVNAEFADIKIAYYHNRTKNVIERDERSTFSNLEQQTIQGAEIQARIDTGRFFGDLGVAYTFENEVCDEHTAQSLSRRNQGSGNVSLSIPRCVQDGFTGGYLLTQAIPELSANLNLGGRFFNKKLELGTRLTYYTGHQNPDLDDWAKYYGEFGINTPFTWDDLILVDAYASYQLTNDFTVELTGTNLTDQFYVDPATRSAVAAPGRVMKLGMTMNF